MKNVMGLILSGGNNSRLKELSAIRSTSAIPIGGKYRGIDFVLSNMVNSGVTNIGVITQFSIRSLMDHLGSGKEWDLDRRNDGLHVFPPYLSSDNNVGWYRGTADAMYNNMSFLKRSNEEYVVISYGNCVYNMLFYDPFKFHIEKNADITVICREMNDYSYEEISILGIMELDGDGRIVDFQEKPMRPKSRLASMGIYIIRRELLISLLEECAAHGDYNFVTDVLIKKLNTLKIYGYKFDGYWRNLSTIGIYYRCNMELLDPEVRYKLFIENGKIYTKVRDEGPAKYNDEAEVRNSIIADGCIIEGSVENSILFRGVNVRKGAKVKDSIVMQDTLIEENASLSYAILDKDVIITSGKNLKGESIWPIIVSKGETV